MSGTVLFGLFLNFGTFLSVYQNRTTKSNYKICPNNQWILDIGLTCILRFYYHLLNFGCLKIQKIVSSFYQKPAHWHNYSSLKGGVGKNLIEQIKTSNYQAENLFQKKLSTKTSECEIPNSSYVKSTRGSNLFRGQRNARISTLMTMFGLLWEPSHEVWE